MKLRRFSLIPLTGLMLAACGAAGTHTAPAAQNKPVTSATVSTATTPATNSRPAHARSTQTVKSSRHKALTATVTRRTSPGSRQSSPRPRHHWTSGPKKPAPKRSKAPKKPVAAAGPASVTLALRGGSNANLSACGAQHHYRVYAAGSTINYSGAVKPVPSGHWKVKLKIKVCRGGAFTDLVKVEAVRNKHTGAFGGSFPTPAAGRYDVRAELYLADRQAARSDKVHFSIR